MSDDMAIFRREIPYVGIDQFTGIGRLQALVSEKNERAYPRQDCQFATRSRSAGRVGRRYVESDGQAGLDAGERLGGMPHV